MSLTHAFYYDSEIHGRTNRDLNVYSVLCYDRGAFAVSMNNNSMELVEDAANPVMVEIENEGEDLNSVKIKI